MALLDKQEIGKRLVAKREATKLSARKYAMEAGIDPSHYAKVEKGELPITDNMMEQLARTYGLEKDYILFGTNVPDGNSGTWNAVGGFDNAKGYQTKYIDSLERENKRLAKDLESSLAAIDRRVEAVATMQLAILEILKVMAAADSKAVYNKTVEILKKNKLEGSFL